MPLISFIANPMVQLIIPVYQRNYDWKIENCNQLFNDLVKLKETKRPNHFFGSIVSAPGGMSNRLIIDGQQRLTTTSLLLLAGIKAVKEEKIEIVNTSLIEQSLNTFLMAPYCSNQTDKHKLVPIEKDKDAFWKVYDMDEQKLVLDSKVTRNFLNFYQRLTVEDKPFTFDELYEVISKLQIISIDLQENDDPQLIFESLNSTGLALQEADKIRNYLLMSLSAEEQSNCYKNYWQKIEEATAGEPTMFLRDYIAIVEQLQKPVKLTSLYFEWKKYMEESGNGRSEELQKMLFYSKYYKQITTGTITINQNGTIVKSAKLSKKMSQLCNLDTDVMNVFLIQFLMYADQNGIEENEIWNVLNVIETYIARRIVCGLNANVLTQVSYALHKDVLKSYDEYEKAGNPTSAKYSEVLSYHILRRDGNYLMPNDARFETEILTRDAYHMLKPYQRFLFERLENGENKEFIDVAQEMKDSVATIEHIMPQTLTSDWRNMLGTDAERIHEQYIDTFANLTLTGVNSELSNNKFIDKRDGKEVKGEFVNGYRVSKYRLTKDVVNYDQWTENELSIRGQKIVNKLMALYPMLSRSFKPLPKPVDEVTLDDDFSPTNRKLVGYTIFGKHYEETVWHEFYLNVAKILIERYPDELDALVNKHYLWTSKVSLKGCTQLKDEIYLWTNMDNKGKINGLRSMFDAIESIAQSELTIMMEIEK